jgi:transcriptional regulator with XRE-family HTH domain
MLRKDHAFAKALKRAMKAAKMTNADVARRVGVRRATVSGWLSGAEPTDPNFEKLVVVFPALAEFRK